MLLDSGCDRLRGVVVMVASYASFLHPPKFCGRKFAMQLKLQIARIVWCPLFSALWRRKRNEARGILQFTLSNCMVNAVALSGFQNQNLIVQNLAVFSGAKFGNYIIHCSLGEWPPVCNLFFLLKGPAPVHRLILTVWLSLCVCAWVHLFVDCTSVLCFTIAGL